VVWISAGSRKMGTAESIEMTDVIDRVKNWLPESRIVLARRILETLECPQPGARGLFARSVQELIGLGRGDSQPPDDETVRRWISERRMEKYGE
jgi:hypothetical protein